MIDSPRELQPELFCQLLRLVSASCVRVGDGELSTRERSDLNAVPIPGIAVVRDGALEVFLTLRALRHLREIQGGAAGPVRLRKSPDDFLQLRLRVRRAQITVRRLVEAFEFAELVAREEIALELHSLPRLRSQGF